MGSNISWSVLVILICCVSTAHCQAIDFDQACSSNQTLSAEEGEIYSPGFKENKSYPLNINCIWILNAVSKKNILFELKFLNIEDTTQCFHGDFLEISYASYVFHAYCGSNIFHKVIFPSANLTEPISIRFYSDYIHSGKGFLLHYKYTTDSSICVEGELPCKNGRCVPTSVTCDLKDDCGDGTDEEDCKERLNQHSECGVPLEEPDLRIEIRIVGGREAVPGSWPWQIDLEYFYRLANGHHCGGSLINSQYVVTALHCLRKYPYPEFWRIHVGTHNVSHKDEYEQIRNVKSIHMLTRVNIADKDIALLRLSAEVKYTKHVRPVCLPPQDLQIKAGTICYTSGWGETKGTGATKVLKQVPVKILESCNFTGIPTTYGPTKYNPRTMLCGDTHNKDGGSCKGDSGGPLVCQVDKKWYFIGITSFSTSGHHLGGICDVEGLPGVYQKVSPHVQWIEDIIKSGQ